MKLAKNKSLLSEEGFSLHSPRKLSSSSAMTEDCREEVGGREEVGAREKEGATEKESAREKLPEASSGLVGGGGLRPDIVTSSLCKEVILEVQC